MKRLTTAVLGAMVALSGCALPGHGPRTYHADFARAVQVFPAVKVRVLGVTVGRVTDVRKPFRAFRDGLSLRLGFQRRRLLFEYAVKQLLRRVRSVDVLGCLQ